MDGAGGVSAVLGRIERIETRFAPPPVDGEVTVAPSTPDDFDPFGDVYQRAVAARPVGAGAPGAFSTTQPAVARQVAVPHSDSFGVSATFGAPSHLATAFGTAAAAIGGVAGAPGVRPVGGYGAMPIPADLRTYGNGRIPASALARVDQAGANHRLHAPAAAAWNNLVAEARSNGFDLRITDSYRSYEQQVDLVRRKGLYSQGGLAAVPGTSNHGWGLAVDADVRDPDLQRWLQVNAPRFGWVESVPREPWHWEFRPHQV